MYNDKMYKAVYMILEICAERTKNWFYNVSNHLFFQIDFFKFHDFSRSLGLFLNSMIFPGLEKVFFIFQVSMIFPEAGNPAPL